jgi:competence protein ComEA
MDKSLKVRSKKDKRMLVLLALGAVILANGWWSNRAGMVQQSTVYGVAMDPSGRPELIRTDASRVEFFSRENIVMLDQQNCSTIPPRFALFFDRPLPINHADYAALTMLPGIGPKLANRILDHRKKGGWFSGSADLSLIRGVSTKLAAGLEDRLCFE